MLVTNEWVERVGLIEKLTFKQRFGERKAKTLGEREGFACCFRNIKEAGGTRV